MSGSTPSRGVLGAFVRQPRLSDRVADDIIATIVSQQLQPGDALPPERELGEQFRVSRTVVREAVRALEARGLVDVRVGSRIRVAAVDAQTVRDAIWHFARTARLDERTVAALCEALDALGARIAASRASEHDLELIGEAVERDDDAFSRAVISATHDELLIALAGAIGALGDRITRSSLDTHRRVADAIAQRDPDAAERAMRGGARQAG